MHRFIVAIGGGLFGSLLIAAAVAAADPTPTPSSAPSPTPTPGTAAQVLGLTQAQLQELRHDGLSLAQIAERQKVALQNVVNALVTRWQDRINARVQAGGLTAAEADQLRTQLQTRATQMVNSTAPGGMQGAAVGAGPRNGNGTGGTGDGTCDGTGPHGPGRP